LLQVLQNLRRPYIDAQRPFSFDSRSRGKTESDYVPDVVLEELCLAQEGGESKANRGKEAYFSFSFFERRTTERDKELARSTHQDEEIEEAS